MLYTIGHSTHDVEYFIQLLNKYKIEQLFDVRSTPYSRFASQFNKEKLSKFVRGHGIEYYHVGDAFGARQSDKSLYDEDGCLDFIKTSQTQKFIDCMKSIGDIVLKDANVALMCTEKDPIDCHRAIMVARAFTLNGFEVHHILADGSFQTHKELDKRLLDMFYPKRNKFSFIDGDDQLQSAYKQRNKQIGYHLK